MRRLFILLFAVATAISAQATTNTITNATSVIIMPMVVARPADVSAPTGRVETAGAIVKENGVVRQLTVNGWEVCPRERTMVIVQKISTGGTVVLSDSIGDIVWLTDACPAIVMTDQHASISPLWIRASGADVTVFSSQR